MVENGNMNTKYKRTEWVNNVTPLNAKNMNHIECGIEELYERALEFNQVLAKDGIYVQQDLNNNIIIGQNVLFTTVIPTDINEDVVYYIIDGESNLRGVIIKGRILYITGGGSGGGGSVVDDSINLTFSCDTPSLIEYTGNNVRVELSWTIEKDRQEITADNIEITKDNIPITLTETNITNKTVSSYVNKLGDTVFTITARFIEEGTIKRTSITITQAYYSYIGFSRELETLTDIIGNSKRILVNKQLNIDGDYQNGNFNDKYFTVYMPYGLSLSTIYSHGIEVPIEYVGIENIPGVVYKKYRSVNRINPMSVLNVVGEIYTKPQNTSEPEYYIGWSDLDAQEFNELTDNEVGSLLVKYTISNTPSYSDFFGENTLFVLAYENTRIPSEVKLISGGQEIIKNIPDDNQINRQDIVLGGKTYKLWGLISNPGDKIIVNFE